VTKVRAVGHERTWGQVSVAQVACTCRLCLSMQMIFCRTAALTQQHIPALCRAFDGAWLCSLGWKERIRPNACSAPVKLSANGNSRSLQYLEEFGARTAMVSLILTFGRRHFGGIWFTLQLRPMPGRLSLATALLLHDGGC
jgi:hypothetical protein